MQWAVGLELLLLSADPWRLVLSTDHPNGGTFLSYPRLIRLLMDRAYRDEQIARLKPEAVRGTALADGLTREYSLYEIAIVTRAAPARLLGLGTKGHLGPGADADVAIYAPDADVETMFSDAASRPQGRACAWSRTASCAESRTGGRSRSSRATTIRGSSAASARVLEDEGSLAFDDYVIDEEEVAPLELERRAHPRHLRRGLRHARDPGRDHGPHRSSWARTPAAVDDGLRHVGDRLQGRGGSRGGARCRGDPRRPPRRQRPALRLRCRRPRQARGRARRPDGPHLPHHRVLRRPARGPGARRRRQRCSATSATAISRAR